MLGPKHAAALMENLHPQPWSNLATKDDVRTLEERLDLPFETQTAKLEALVRERIDAQTRLLVLSLIGAVLTAAGIALGAAAI